MSKTNIKAVNMPHKYNRYMIINVDTGEILDNAQGYGYRTAQKAHAAWNYKHPNPKQAHNRSINQKRNKAFLKQHKHLDDTWAEICLDAYKNGEEPTYQDFKELIQSIQPPFEGNIYSLYRYFQKN